MASDDTENSISIREFAKRDGCDEKLVRTAITKGRLVPYADGRLVPGFVGTGWRKTNRHKSAAPSRGPLQPFVPEVVFMLHDMATNSAQSMAIDLLKILPEATVKPIYDSLQSYWRGCASSWADELVTPPGGLDRWREHPFFTSPAPDVWAELLRVAGPPPDTEQTTLLAVDARG